MAETTKTKIIDINTNKAEKNVKSLKQQIKELRDQLGTLEKGTAEYDRVAKQLADTNQRQIEVNEAMQYSNKDLGATLSNLTRVSAGVVGAFNGINAVMAMMGSDSEAAQEAMKNIQLTMAVIQGMGAIDTAMKALKGLSVAFGEIGTASQIAGTAGLAAAEDNLQKEIGQTTAAVNAETASLGANAVAKTANAAATKGMGVAEATSVTGATKGISVFGKLGNVFKGLLNGVKMLGAALGGVGIAIGAVVAAVTIYTAVMRNLNKERKEQMDFNSNIEAQYKTETQEVAALAGALNDENVSLENKKAILDKLNKTIPEFNGKIDETTKAVTYSKEALDGYLKNLKAKITYEAYQDKINAKLKEQAEWQMKINKRMNDGWGNLFGRISRLERKIKDADIEVKELVGDMMKINLSDAFDENKITTNAGKSLKEIAKEIKAIYQALVETVFDEREFTAIYNGIYDKTEILYNRINRVMRTKEFGIKIAPEFQELLKKAEHPIVTRFEVTADFIFGEGEMKKFEDELIKKEEEIKNKVDSHGRGLTEKQLEDLKKEVETEKQQLINMKALAEAVQEYANWQTELIEGAKQRTEAEEEYNKQLEIQKDYIKQSRDVNSKSRFADLDKEIKLNEYQLQLIYDRIAAEQKEYDELRRKDVLNKEQTDRLDELDKKLIEDRKTRDNLEIALDTAKYNRRLEQLRKFYEDSDVEYANYMAKLEEKRYMAGGGVEDYNTQYDILKLDEERLTKQLDYVDWYYTLLLSNVEKGSEEWKRIEAEKNKAIEDLEVQRAQVTAELTEESYKKKIRAAEAYYNAASAITGQIQGLLQAEMEGYDENSKKYKQLQYTNGVIDTISGTLAAFMSGVKSGIPGPYNLILAAALAATTFATGMVQLNNLQNEKLSGATTATPATTTGFSTYDTLAYEQQNDILGSISDQRVYVVESDVTRAQNRVRVMENSATF